MSAGIKPLYQPAPDQPSFLQDIQDLFAMRRFAHVANWRFSEPLAANDPVRGNQLWDEMENRAEKTGIYYAYSDEVELIEHCFAQMGPELPDDITLIDFGPGPEKSIRGKIGPIIKSLEPKVKRYVGIDRVRDLLDKARKFFSAEHPQIEFLGLNQDFYEHALPLPRAGKRLSVIFGLTMFNIATDPRIKNLPEEILVDMLRRLAGHLRKGEFLAVSQDLNRDQNLMTKLYSEQKDLWMNLLLRVRRDLKPKGNFNPAGFEYAIDWLPETNASVRCFVVNKDMDFILGEESFTLKQGQKFFIHNAFKYLESDFVAMAQQAGLSPFHTSRHASGRTAMHVFEKD